MGERLGVWGTGRDCKTVLNLKPYTHLISSRTKKIISSIRYHICVRCPLENLNLFKKIFSGLDNHFVSMHVTLNFRLKCLRKIVDYSGIMSTPKEDRPSRTFTP